MKKLLIIALTLMLVVPFSGCKKGEEDPGISLRSRDSRVEGTWKLSKIETTETKVDKYSTATAGSSSVKTTTTTETFNGTTLLTSELIKDESGGDTDNEILKLEYTYSLTVTINDDNTYTYELISTLSKYCTDEISDCTPVPISASSAASSTIKEGGDWYWRDANDKKINLVTQAPYFSGTLKKCSNSELIFEESWDESNVTTGVDFFGDSYIDDESEKGTFTYTWVKEK